MASKKVDFYYCPSVYDNYNVYTVNGAWFPGMNDDQRFKALTQQRPFKVEFKRPLWVDTYFKVDGTDTCENLGMVHVKCRVVDVIKDGFADKNGIKIGDKIQEIGDQDVRCLTTEEMEELLVHPYSALLPELASEGEEEFKKQNPKPKSLSFKRLNENHFDIEELNMYRNQCNLGAIDEGDLKKQAEEEKKAKEAASAKAKAKPKAKSGAGNILNGVIIGTKPNKKMAF
ncbi:MAG: hypothetical protein CMI56_00935 [Parcubacteria group bacterium]|nr:hypothetical protein [Parcubacteria group bacterium]|tara:strand:- start:947 stop:1633 length:687 start_codon:yes stop_codon:yes gene_type:complete